MSHRLIEHAHTQWGAQRASGGGGGGIPGVPSLDYVFNVMPHNGVIIDTMENSIAVGTGLSISDGKMIFDGTPNATIQIQPLIDLNGQAFVVEASVNYPNTLAGNTGLITDRGPADGSSGFGLALISGGTNVVTRIGYGASNVSINAEYVSIQNTPTVIQWVYDGTDNWRLFFNNVEVDNDTNANDFRVVSSGFWIGAYGSSGYLPAGTQVEYARIYRGARYYEVE